MIKPLRNVTHIMCVKRLFYFFLEADHNLLSFVDCCNVLVDHKRVGNDQLDFPNQDFETFFQNFTKFCLEDHNCMIFDFFSEDHSFMFTIHIKKKSTI